MNQTGESGEEDQRGHDSGKTGSSEPDSKRAGEQDSLGPSSNESVGKKPLYKTPVFVAVASIVIVIGVIGAFLIWLHERHFVFTTDAYIDGNVTEISARISAPVIALHVSDNQLVHRGDLMMELDPTDFEVALGLGCLQVILDKGQEDDRFGSTFITVFVILSAIGIAGMIFWELFGTKNPIVDIPMFRDRSFLFSNLMMFSTLFILLSTTQLLPQFVQDVLAYNAAKAGLMLMPGGFVVMLLMPVAGFPVKKIQPKYLICFGFVMHPPTDMKSSKPDLRSQRFFRSIKFWTFNLGLWIFAAGCAVGPDYKPPDVSVERHFAESGGAVTTNSPVSDWWNTFHDPELGNLIRQASSRNYDLQIAAARIREARYQRNIAGADLFPNIDADAGNLRGYGSKNVKRSPMGKGGLPGEWTDLYQIGFDSTWEIDVFGGTRRRVEAAEDLFQAAVESERGVIVTLYGEIADDYLELRGVQKRLEVAQKDLDAERAVLELTRSESKTGLASDVDVSQAGTEAAILASRIPPLKAEEHRLIHALSVLLARQPDDLTAELDEVRDLPVVPPKIPAGLPSQLLERRPDVRAAERQLAAATANIGSAKADLFPRFALTSGSMGLDTSAPETLFNWDSRYFLISPTVTWRIFDAGRIFSNIKYQKAKQQEADLQFRSTVLTALKEVEDTLAAYALEHERRAELADALHGSAITLALAQQQYQHGLTSFLNVLDAERNVYSEEDQVAQSDAAICTDLVALYKALGGGWQTEGSRVAERK